MEMNMILGILQVLIYVVLGGLSLYFRTNAKLNTHVAEYIDKAEEIFKDTAKAGGQKFTWVVENLYALIPYPMNLVFTKEMIGELVQKTFDQITSYTVKQLDKAVDKVVKESE